MQQSKIHLVRTTHHDTGEVEMLCGQTRPGVEEPPYGSAPCGECYVAAINLNRSDISQVAEVIKEWTEYVERSSKRFIAYIDDIDRHLERLDKRLRKIEKKGKKS